MKIALELIPAHRTIDDGYSRWMYSVPNAMFARDGTHEYQIILGAQGNPALLNLNPRCTVVQTPPGNQNLRQQFSAAKLAQRWGADVLHNFGAPASLLWTKPLILTIHDAAIYTHPESFPKRWVLFQKFAYAILRKKNPLVITVSEFSRQEIAEHMQFPLDRIHVVYPIPSYASRDISSDEKIFVRTQLHLPEKYFFYIGIIEPRKNLLRVIQAFEKYRENGGDAELVIGGRVGWKATPVADAAKASLVADHIFFPGYISDEQLPIVIVAAHAFVYPSLYEGFGAPPVEALMFDVPVLSSNASCLPEVLGDAALLVDPLDVAAIADGLLRVDANAALRSTLIANGKVQRMRYSADNTAAGIFSVYDRIEREK